MKRGKLRWSLYFLCLLALLNVWGCSDDDDPPKPVSTTLSGTVSEGPVAGATISIYKIENGIKGTLITTATTDSNGDYTANVGTYTGAILIEATGGTYIDEATGETRTLTEVRRAALPSSVGGEVSVCVTPLTELAVRKAGSYLDPAAIDAANKMISQLLGPDGDILKDRPFDPTVAGADDGATESEVIYTLLLAALSQAGDNGNMTPEEVLDLLEDDLEDNELDDQGAMINDAITDFIGNENNENGLSDNFGHLDDIIDGGFAATGDLAELKNRLLTLLNDPTTANLAAFVAYLTFTPDTPEENLFRGVAELAFIYNSEAGEFFKDLGIDFDTDFDNETIMNGITESIVNLSTSAQEDAIIGTFSELRGRLQTANTYFAKAEGAHTTISLAGFDTIHMDDIDVKVLETMTNLMIAACAFVESVDYTVSDWTVTSGGNQVDIRTIDDVTEDQEEEFITSNPGLLGVGSTTKLEIFRSALKNAATTYGKACTALAALSDAAKKARVRNAFSMDDAFDAQIASALNTHTIASIIAALDTKNTPIKSVDSDEADPEIYVPGDGFAYEKITHTIFYYTYTINPDYANYTLFDFANGDKSVRNWLDVADQTEDDIELYIRGSRTNVATGVVEIDWDEPIPAPEVPSASITIDGSISDWASVPYFINTNELKAKLAINGSGKMCALIEKSGSPYYVYFGLASGYWDDYWTSLHGIQIYFNSYDTPNWSARYDGSTSGVTSQTVNSGAGIEVSLPSDAASELIDDNLLNGFSYSVDYSGAYYGNSGAVKLTN